MHFPMLLLLLLLLIPWTGLPQASLSLPQPVCMLDHYHPPGSCGVPAFSCDHISEGLNPTVLWTAPSFCSIVLCDHMLSPITHSSNPPIKCDVPITHSIMLHDQTLQSSYLITCLVPSIPYAKYHCCPVTCCPVTCCPNAIMLQSCSNHMLH